MDNAENDTKTVAEGEKYEMEGKSLVVKDVQEEDLGVYRWSLSRPIWPLAEIWIMPSQL